MRLEYKGTKCTIQTIRNALAATLPDIRQLERRLNRSLATDLTKALFRKSRRIAIDLTLIPCGARLNGL